MRGPVLILGETGTGKERVATELHARSRRAARMFKIINCPSLEPALADSELFGHAKDAFTGAARNRAGLIASADGGTVFLDEVGHLPFTVQQKLLRALVASPIRAVGSDSDTDVDVRYIAATSADVAAKVRDGSMAKDFLHRFQTQIRVPALRERPEDLEALAAHFIAVNRGVEDMNANARGLTPAALGRLERHSWPGNVRELENVITGALSRSAGESCELLDERHLSIREEPPDEFQAEALASVLDAHAERVLSDLLAGRRAKASLDELSRRELHVPFRRRLAKAFVERFQGRRADEMAKSLFGYETAEPVRKFARSTD